MENNDEISRELIEVKKQWPQLLETITNTANAVGRKRIVYDLKISRSALDNVLADRNRHALKAKHLVYLLLSDESGVILKKLAALTGHRVERKRVMTPEERGKAIEQKLLQRMGPMGQELIDEALREAGE